MRLYRVWLEDYEINEKDHSSSVGHVREAEGAYGYEATPNPEPADLGNQGGKPKSKPKPKPNADKQNKVKTEDQLVRQVLGLKKKNIDVSDVFLFFVHVMEQKVCGVSSWIQGHRQGQRKPAWAIPVAIQAFPSWCVAGLERFRYKSIWCSKKDVDIYFEKKLSKQLQSQNVQNWNIHH